MNTSCSSAGTLIPLMQHLNAIRSSAGCENYYTRRPRATIIALIAVAHHEIVDVTM